MNCLDEGVTVYKGPVAEGPKMFKKDGYYYISIPEGGVSKGWQTVLRSKDVYGPYESRRVLERGSTDVNGPHQGRLSKHPMAIGGSIISSRPGRVAASSISSL